MNNSDLVRQFEYDRWANLLWVEYLAQPDVPDLYRQIMSHILGAQMIWVTGLESESLSAIPAPIIDSASVEALHERWISAINSRPAEELIHYRRTTGEPLASTLEDIALHVVNHGTYHRGELRGLCRADSREGFPETDRIRFTFESS